MVDTRGVPTRVAKLLNRKCVLAFPESKFLQILCSLIQELHEKRVVRDNLANDDAWNATIETARTLRTLQIYPNKNTVLAGQLKSQLKEAVLSIETKSPGDIETLFFIIAETRPNSHWNVGQTIKMGNDEIYTVLDAGFEMMYKILLYCDKSDPKLQTYLNSKDSDEAERKSFTYKSQPLIDSSQADTETGARNSIFMDPEVISKLLWFLKES